MVDIGAKIESTKSLTPLHVVYMNHEHHDSLVKFCSDMFEQVDLGFQILIDESAMHPHAALVVTIFKQVA